MRDKETNGRGARRGLGPFTGGQLTIVVVALVFGVIAYPFAAGAANGAFSNNSPSIPAVLADNTNAKGVGINGTGKKYGVYSNGPLGVAAGKALSCTKCVGAGALASSANAGRLIYQHNAVNFDGPWDGTAVKATFTVPAGLMCVSGSVTASANPAGPIGVTYTANLNGVPTVGFDMFANEINTHKDLPEINFPCTHVAGGTYHFVAIENGGTISDPNDRGSIFVEVFSS